MAFKASWPGQPVPTLLTTLGHLPFFSSRTRTVGCQNGSCLYSLCSVYDPLPPATYSFTSTLPLVLKIISGKLWECAGQCRPPVTTQHPSPPPPRPPGMPIILVSCCYRQPPLPGVSSTEPARAMPTLLISTEHSGIHQLSLNSWIRNQDNPDWILPFIPHISTEEILLRTNFTERNPRSLISMSTHPISPRAAQHSSEEVWGRHLTDRWSLSGQTSRDPRRS